MRSELNNKQIKHTNRQTYGPSPQAIEKKKQRRIAGHKEIIQSQKKSLLSETNRRVKWSQEDTDFILTSPLHDIDIAKKLGRTLFAVLSKRRNLRRAGLA